MASIKLLASGGAQSGRLRPFLTAVLSVYLVLYHIYIGTFGPPTNAVFLPVHLMIALGLVYLLYPLNGISRPVSTAVDVLCFAGCVVLLTYFLSILDTWEALYVTLGTRDYVMGILLLLLLFEAIRRTVGWSMIILALIFCVHALFADKFPGVLRGPPVRVEALLQALVVGDTGVFGTPLLVAAQYIVLFLLFGRMLQVAGAGTFFTRIAFAFFGHRVGGPAKAGVVASALFGTMSGSGVSNVLTTGSFTIPMMLRLGYRPPFAGGVEASAAVGGAIMPPVMGAVAFMMAEFMGVDYLSIVVAAAIPAFLYYFAIYWTVHFEARKEGLKRMPRSSMPDPWRIIRHQGYLAVPLVMIAVMLGMGYSIILVALVTSLGTFLLSFTSPSTQLSPGRLAESIEMTGRVACSLSATCACAGIIIGAMFATGLSFQVSQLVLGLVNNQLWLLLLVSALISLLLGTGLTASAVYITMVATVIPVLKASGVPDMAAHMFSFYYGVVSDITPPTALAAVAAAGLAKANPMKTMLEASRLGIAAFIVPVTFVYQPALLMIGTPIEIVSATVSACLGMLFLAAALAGFFRRRLRIVQRLAFAGAGFLLIGEGGYYEIAGIALAGLAMAFDFLPQAAKVAETRRGPPGHGDEEWAPRGMLGRWLARRIESEKADAQKEMETEGLRAEVPETADLEAWLKDDRISAEGTPPDSRAWGAWAVLAMGTIAMGYMGSTSIHAVKPLLWLLALLILTLWFVGGLILTLRRPLRAGATAG